MNLYDVTIIGAGPAGAIAAKHLAQKGYSVALLDRKTEVGSPVQCGEAITKYSLEKMNISTNQTWIRQSIKGVKILLPNNKYFYSTVPGYSIDRKAFDQWLVDQAIDAGAEIFLKNAMKSINHSKNKWNIKTSDNKTYQTNILIGADGAESKTASLLGLIQNKVFIKAFQYTFNKNDINFSISDWLCMHMDEKYQGGYGWIFPRGNEYNVGVGGIYTKKKDLNRLCHDFSFDPKLNNRITAGLIPYSFEMKSRIAKNALIIGDAAGITNPVTGGGIHAALYSGTIAAESIDKALEDNNIALLNEYDKKIKKSMFLHPIHLKTASYFNAWSNDDWIFLGDSVHGLDMADLSLIQCMKIGIKHPSYMLRAKELLTIRKDMKINQKYGW